MFGELQLHLAPCRHIPDMEGGGSTKLLGVLHCLEGTSNIESGYYFRLRVVRHNFPERTIIY